MPITWQQDFTKVAAGASLDGTTPDIGPPVVPTSIPGWPFSGTWDLLPEIQGSSLGGLYMNDIHPDHFVGGFPLGGFVDLGTNWVTTDMEGSLTVVGDSSKPETATPADTMYGQLIFAVDGGSLSAGIADNTGKLAIRAQSFVPPYALLQRGGTVPSPNIDIENEVTWSYNGSTQDFVIRSAYDELEWDGQTAAPTPKSINDAWRDTPTSSTFFGLDAARIWYPSAISRWTSARVGTDEWILRHFPRDDELGMSLNGLGRVNSAAATSHPTSQQRSQRVGRVPGAGYL